MTQPENSDSAIDPRDLPRVQAFLNVPPGTTHPDPWVAFRSLDGTWRVMERGTEQPLIHQSGGPCPEIFDTDLAYEHLVMRATIEDEGFWLVDLSTGRLQLNAHARRLLGLIGDRTRVDDLYGIINEPDRSVFRQALQECHARRTEFISMNATVITAHGLGACLSWYGRRWSISDDCRIIGRVRRSEIGHQHPGYHQTLLSGSPDFVVVFSLDGQLIDVLADMNEILGWRRDEAIGTRDFLRLHPDDRSIAFAQLQDIQAGKITSADSTLRILAKDGSWLWFAVTARRVLLPDRRDVIVVNHWNIDQLKRAELAVTRQRDDLDRIVAERTTDLTTSNERLRTEIEEHQVTQALARKREAQLVQAYNQATMGRLASMVAHQVNAPLSAVRDLVGDVLREVTDRPAAVTSLGLVSSELERLSRTIRNLLTYTRQRLALRTPVAVAEVIRTVAALFQPTLTKRGITLHLDLGDDLPVLEGDADLFQEVLVNLLENARDALSHHHNVWIHARLVNGVVEIVVSDDGPGLGPEPDRVFEPFYTTKTHGTGLGLPIVRQVCEGYGGTITAHHRDPQGAEFRVSLPRRDLP
jgi:PAS domain S-box-containing protein